jgi:cyclic pyranopterin phosphate synthase
LKDAGLHRVTVSLDTLRPEVFQELSRRSTHGEVIAGIRSVPQAGFTDTKLDTVVMRGVNHDELADLIEFSKTVPAQARFIEYMDVGGATNWSKGKVFSRAEMLDSLRGTYGEITPIRRNSAAPADTFRLPDGTTFGIVSSTTQPFCAWCDRSRLTADGMWYRCLYALIGTDLRSPLRDGASTTELTDIVAKGWTARRDRGAVDRLKERERKPLISVDGLKNDPHLEMHTRGG